jgi:hypothetical protein
MTTDNNNNDITDNNHNEDEIINLNALSNRNEDVSEVDMSTLRHSPSESTPEQQPRPQRQRQRLHQQEHQQQQQQQQQQQEESNIITLTDVDIVSRWDGKPYMNHSGNLVYRQRIMETRPLYQSIQDQKERLKVTKGIVEEFQAMGARFLIERRTGTFEVLTDSEARSKVRDALRIAYVRVKDNK